MSTLETNPVVAAVRDARSFLFVPGDRPDMFDKARASGADCVILDLEDAVAEEAKRRALDHCRRWLMTGGRGVVRVNGVGTPWHEEEVAALRGSDAVVMVPKSESAERLREVVARLDGTAVLALVETAVGVRDVEDLCAVAGLLRVALGNVDLAGRLGVDPASGAALAYARSRLVVASCAAGLPGPVDGVTTAVRDPGTLAGDLAQTKALGLTGKLCIHPAQVASVNEALSPTEAEVAWAERVLGAHAAAGGVMRLDGEMVDVPVVARARRILGRSDRARAAQSRPSLSAGDPRKTARRRNRWLGHRRDGPPGRVQQ